MINHACIDRYRIPELGSVWDPCGLTRTRAMADLYLLIQQLLIDSQKIRNGVCEKKNEQK
jgi:hypothetical protein